MSISGIQGLPLEVTVVGCYNLEDKEWLSRQDPYVCIQYGSSKHRTKTCTDGGKNPTFQEKFVIPLIEGLREINVEVWNSNTLSSDEFIGSGRIQLHKTLSQGFDDANWPLQSRTGRHSGEIRFILHYSSANQYYTATLPPTAPHQYATPSSAMSQLLPFSSSQAPGASYPPTVAAYTAYPPHQATYPPSLYPPTPPAGYPPISYPPQPAYPPPPPAQTYYYPPGPPSGLYPPPPSY